MYSGKINFHEVSDKYYWLVKGDNILVDGKEMDLCHMGCNFIADTGNFYH